jgi:glycosyltransferase involved in cell wall biosynthesis
MKIGIAAPVPLHLLDIDFKGKSIPDTNNRVPITSLLINALLQKGHEIVVYTTSYKIAEPVVIESDRATICVAPFTPHPGRDFFKLIRQNLIQLMNKYPADIINAHWSYEYAWAALDTNIPVVVTVRDHAFTILKYHLIPFRVVRWLMNSIVLSRAKELTTNSHYLFELLSKSEQKKTTIIHNFYPKIIENYFVSNEKKLDYIVSVNNGFGKRKNIENGLLAFQQIRKKYPSLTYYLLGHDMDMEGLAHQYAKKHNLTPGVVFMGPKSYTETMEIIAFSKMLLHTSREESFGNTLLEAMVLGTPVVGGSKSGNVPFLLGHGKYGVLCNVDSVDEIQKAAEKILSNSTYANQLTLEAHHYATSSFSEDSIIDQYINLYKKVLQVKAYDVVY